MADNKTVVDTSNPSISRNRRSSSGKLKKRRAKKFFIFFAVLCVLVAGGYAGGRYFFQSHYFPNTKINGVDCSYENKEDSFTKISDYLNTYKLSVKSEDGKLMVNAEDVGLSYENSGDLDKILNDQDADRWFMHLRSSNKFQVMKTHLDDAALKKTVESLACMNPKKPRVSENPTLKYNKKTNEYDVIEGAIGNQVDEEKFTAAVKEAMLNGQEEVSLLTKKYYIPSKYNASSKVIVKAKDKADKYVKTVVHLKDGDNELDVDGSKIHKFVKISKKYKVSIDEDAVKSYVKKKIAKKFGTGDLTVIDSPGSGKIYVSDGDGAVVNVSSETEKLLANIKSGKEVDREPQYITDYLYSDYGDVVHEDYVDVNLGSQKVYVVINDKLRVETSCVTGNVSTGHSTPTGIYRIAYKTTNYTMKKYNAHVNYWMPYDTTYGIGLHDATWRGSFGGDIYRYDGSHGCVNLPLYYARQIYNIVYSGMPVVVHW